MRRGTWRSLLLGGACVALALLAYYRLAGGSPNAHTRGAARGIDNGHEAVHRAAVDAHNPHPALGAARQYNMNPAKYAGSDKRDTAGSQAGGGWRAQVSLPPCSVQKLPRCPVVPGGVALRHTCMRPSLPAQALAVAARGERAAKEPAAGAGADAGAAYPAGEKAAAAAAPPASKWKRASDPLATQIFYYPW